MTLMSRGIFVHIVIAVLACFVGASRDSENARKEKSMVLEVFSRSQTRILNKTLLAPASVPPHPHPPKLLSHHQRGQSLNLDGHLGLPPAGAGPNSAVVAKIIAIEDEELHFLEELGKSVLNGEGFGAYLPTHTGVVTLAISLSLAVSAVMLQYLGLWTAPDLWDIGKTAGIAIVYILWAIHLSYANKYLDSPLHFPHPVSLVTIQMLTCALSSFLLYQAAPNMFPALMEVTSIPAKERAIFQQTVLVVAGCLVTTLVLENAALFYTSVAFLQMMKEVSLLMVFGLSILLKQEVLTYTKLLLLICVGVGSMMCVHGEVHFVLWGLVLQLTSSSTNAVRQVLQAKLLQAPSLTLDPLSFIVFLSFIGSALLLPAAGLEIYFSSTSVLSALKATWLAVLGSCFLAVGMNVIIAVLVQRTSAVGLATVGSIKNAIMVVLSMQLMGKTTTVLQLVGCAMIFTAVPVFSLCKMQESKSQTSAKVVEPPS